MSDDAMEVPPVRAVTLNGAGGLRAEDVAGPRWVQLDFASAEGKAWLRKDERLSEAVCEAMLESESRPRAVAEKSGVLVVLRGVNLNPGSDLADMVSVRIWLEKDRIITASRRRLQSLEDVLQSLREGKGPETACDVLLAIIEQLGFYIGDVVEKAGERLEAAETDVNDPEVIVRSSPFSSLRRQSARIRRYLAPQRDALERLSRNPDDLFLPDEAYELREHANRFTLLLEELDLVRERALVAQEEFLGILAHHQNQRMLVLAIVSAVFLPLSFLTGLMGMNVAGLPGMENPWSFWILVGLMTTVAAGILLLFRIKKWL